MLAVCVVFLPALMKLTSGTTVDCNPGLLYPGPSSSTFFKCVERRYFKQLLKFNCPPGTFFDHELSLCLGEDKKCCSTSHHPSVIPEERKKIKPSPVKPSTGSKSSGVSGVLQGELGQLSLSGLPPSGNELHSLVAPSSLGVPKPEVQTLGLAENNNSYLLFPLSMPGSQQTSDKISTPQSTWTPDVSPVTKEPMSLSPLGLSLPSVPKLTRPEFCAKYQLDPISEYNCQFPGMIPVDGRCNMFYLCINTMDCIVKGFSVRCPNNYHFNQSKNRCLHQEEIGHCPYPRKEAPWGEDKKPSIQLNAQNMNIFFEADDYWSYKLFLPKASDREDSS